MTKEKTLYPFNQCITDHSPYASEGSENFIVIYAVEDNDIPYHNDIIVFGYLDAAERLISSFYSDDQAGSVPHAGDDGISLPLLHLYSHVLELSLKSAISQILDHASICERLNNNQSDIRKVMSSHNLPELVSLLKDTLPSETEELHFFRKFHDIADFICNFAEFGIDSMSTRYITYKNKMEKYSIYNKQSYLIPKKMHENVKNTLYIIDKYVNGEHFYFCNCGSFTQARIDELEQVFNKMSEYRSIFMQFKQNIDSYPDTVDKQQIKCSLTSALYKEISILNQMDITLIALGFHFSNGIDNTSIKDIERISEDENIDTIIRHALLYERLIEEIKEHIGYLSKYVI